MAKKDIGVIIQFDDKECTDAERGLLLGRFAYFLAEVALQQEKESKNAKRVNFPKTQSKQKIAI